MRLGVYAFVLTARLHTHNNQHILPECLKRRSRDGTFDVNGMTAKS